MILVDLLFYFGFCSLALLIFLQKHFESLLIIVCKYIAYSSSAVGKKKPSRVKMAGNLETYM